MISEEKIKQVVSIIVKEVSPEKIFLFGSYAYGTPNEDSDLDLLIIKDTFYEDRREQRMRIRKALRGQGIPFDLILYTQNEIDYWVDTPVAFVTTIINHGKQIYPN
ncbi:MAG: nucleotidyltransferase domain-containing protein [Bacteroidetes bacterium]|nr:nucleotidyltransferase domain-containing protein [Bacteroidota bacterium]